MNLSHQTLVESNYISAPLFSPATVLGEPGFSEEVMTWAIAPGALDLMQRLLLSGTHWETSHAWLCMPGVR